VIDHDEADYTEVTDAAPSYASLERERDALAAELAALRRVVQAVAVISPDGLAQAISVLLVKRDAEAHRATQAALDALVPRSAVEAAQKGEKP